MLHAFYALWCCDLSFFTWVVHFFFSSCERSDSHLAAFQQDLVLPSKNHHLFGHIILTQQAFIKKHDTFFFYPAIATLNVFYTAFILGWWLSGAFQHHLNHYFCKKYGAAVLTCHLDRPSVLCNKESRVLYLWEKKKVDRIKLEFRTTVFSFIIMLYCNDNYIRLCDSFSTEHWV